MMKYAIAIKGAAILLAICLMSASSHVLTEEENALEHHDLKRTVASMIGADIAGDEKSLVWDGQEMLERQDPLDSKDIMDGRGGPYRFSRFPARLITVYSVDKVHLLADESIRVDDDDVFIAEIDTRYVSIRRMEEDIQQLIEKERIKQEQGMLNEAQVDSGYETAPVAFSGLFETQRGKLMAGLTAFLLSDDATVYQCTYAGVGNYSDIAAEANMLIHRTFR